MITFSKRALGNPCGSLSNEALASIGACGLLVLLMVLAMRDNKPRFEFEKAPLPPAASPSPEAQPDEMPAAGQATTSVPTMPESTDFAKPPSYLEIHEQELGKIYAAAPGKDRRALKKVARLGGFDSPEAMSAAFGYPSVDAMLRRWQETIEETPRFRPKKFGTDAAPPLPREE